ncbi:MAG: hypothetical protein K0R18_1997 [Bacillales bacterium]|jgi:hypothetical protein|nr:hypothetical protein [Bacillales bacterium]
MEEPRVKLKPEVMLKMLREELKQEIRQELVNEMQPPVQKPWLTIKAHIDNLLFKNYRNWDAYRIQQAIYTIIHYSCDISRVSDLKEDQIDNAKMVADGVFEMLFPSDLTGKNP